MIRLIAIVHAVLTAGLILVIRHQNERLRSWRDRFRDAKSDWTKQEVFLGRQVEKLRSRAEGAEAAYRATASDLFDRALTLVSQKDQELLETRMALRVLWQLQERRMRQADVRQLRSGRRRSIEAAR